MCSVELRIILLCLTVWWVSLGLVDARRILPAWLHCTISKVWWWRHYSKGLTVFLGPLLPVKANLNASAYFGQCNALNFLGIVWGRSSMTVPQCTMQGSLVWKNLIGLDRALPQLHQTPLEWTGTEISSQAFSSSTSAWPHKYSTRWEGKDSHRKTPKIPKNKGELKLLELQRVGAMTYLNTYVNFI